MPQMTADIYAEQIAAHGWKIGPHTYGNPKIIAEGQSRLSIGDYCSIAGGVTISLGAEHRVDWATTYPFPALHRAWGKEARIPGHPHTRGDVVIGNDVWLGSHARVLSGVTIGDGAVIGTGAVVTGDVAPYVVVMGNPGRAFKKRFSDATIERLLKLRWWDWPEEKVAEAIPFLCSPDVEAMLERFEEK